MLVSSDITLNQAWINHRSNLLHSNLTERVLVCVIKDPKLLIPSLPLLDSSAFILLMGGLRSVRGPQTELSGKYLELPSVIN